MKFVERIEQPDENDKNWKHYTKGGYNYCIEINKGLCIPNCTGYAWGRWRELLGGYHKLSRGHAEKWYNYNDGYKRGKTPKLGAVICWKLGEEGNAKDGCGHVGIVERILDDGSLVVSESHYSGTWFDVVRIPSDYHYPNTRLEFQGFIYLPIEFEEEKRIEVTTDEAIHKMAEDVIAGKYGNGRLNRMNKLYTAIQSEVNRILK